MKKVLLTVAVAGTGIWAALGAVKPGENIIVNGRFDCDQQPFPPAWNATVPDQCNGNVSGGPDGAPYVSIFEKGDAKTEVIVRQKGITLVPGGKYRLSVAVRTKGFKSRNCGALLIDDGWFKCESVGPMPEDTNGEWKRMSKEFTCFAVEQTNKYAVTVYACSLKGRIDFADFRLEALDEKALAGSAPTVLSPALTMPRLVPFAPLLWNIPESDPTVEFRFFGKLPTEFTIADCDVVVTAEGAEGRTTVPLSSKPMRLKLPAGAREGGLSAAIVCRKTNATVKSFDFTYRVRKMPKIDASRQRRLNNLCTEVLSERHAGGTSDWAFDMPRRGWAYLAVRGSGTHEVSVDGVPVRFAAADRKEMFRHLEDGSHRLQVRGAADVKVVVRSIAEIINDAPCQFNKLEGGPQWDWALEEKYALPALTTEVSGIVPEKERDGTFRRRGYWYINNIGAFGPDKKPYDAARLKREIRGSRGLTIPFYDGVALDEIFFWWPNQIHDYAAGLWDYCNADRPIRTIRTWICGRPGAAGLDHDFVAACVNASRGTGRLQIEGYCRTCPTEKEARDYLGSYLGVALSSFRSFYPLSIPNTVMALGNFVQYPIISLVHHPEVDYKYYLDMQFNYLANDPTAKDLGGIGYWGTHYSDDEMHRWSFMLMRHYVIEGRTDMLSKAYGYSYRPDHLANGDFRGTLEPWRTDGDVTVAKKDKFANASQSRWGLTGDIGDSFAVLKRTEDAVATITQTAKGLVPGRLYRLQFMSFDADDVLAWRSVAKDIALKVALSDGAEIRRDLSWKWVDRRKQGFYAVNTGVPKVCLHHIVFKALKSEVEVTLTNKAAKPGERWGVNGLSLNPYLSREEQGDNWCARMAR